jgi:hypothetical protein
MKETNAGSCPRYETGYVVFLKLDLEPYQKDQSLSSGVFSAGASNVCPRGSIALSKAS